MSQNSFYYTDYTESSQHHPKRQQNIQDKPIRTPPRKTFQPSTQFSGNEQTILKLNQPRTQLYHNTTPRPQRKIILYDQNKQRHFFPLFKDKDLGISKDYQDLLIESWNDDDKRTSSTQLKRGMDQTINDLHEAFGYAEASQKDQRTVSE